MYAYIPVCLHTCMLTYLYAYIPVCLHTYMLTYLYANILICLHTYMFTYLYVFTQTVDVEAYNALIKIMILVTKVLNEYPPKVGTSVIVITHLISLITGFSMA